MNAVTIYFLSILGIFKFICLVFLALLIALSTHTHFNSHWTYHSRIIQRGVESNKVTLQELRNEYEECCYNSLLYTGISTKDSEETVNVLGARQYSSTFEKQCPHPVFELFLVSSAICIFIVLIVSFLLICGILPNLTLKDALEKLRILDFLLFLLASIFLCIGTALFWYSTYHISQWCDHKSRVYDSLDPRSGSPSSKNTLRMHHDDKVDLIPANEDLSSNNNLRSAELLYPSTKTPPQVFYLTRAKRSSENVEMMPFIFGDDFEVQRMHEEQYLDLCNMRQMTTEKYCTVAVAFICTLLHIATAVVIYRRFGKGTVSDRFHITVVDDENGNQRRLDTQQSQDSSAFTQPEGRLTTKTFTRDASAGDKRINFDNKVSTAVGPSQEALVLHDE